MTELIQTLWPWSAFVISLAIGLLIGLERERSPAAKAGLRTFSLVALAGTIGALLGDRTGQPWLLAAGLLILGGMMIAAYLRGEEAEDPGTTTIAAVVVCYGLGAMIWYGLYDIAVALAITTTALLYFKTELRGATQRLSRKDLVSILQFAVLSFVILPVLPNQEYGPYHALNPHHIWLMVVLISGLSLVGYAALRLGGHRYGTLLTGFFGGTVSSTATTLAFARNSKENPHLTGISALIILIANLVVLLRLSIVIGVVMPGLWQPLSSMLLGGLLAGSAFVYLLWRRQEERPAPPELEVANPAEIRSALGFGALFALVLFAAAWLGDVVGKQGIYAVALVSGLTDVDAITLSSLRLHELGNLGTKQTAATILIALIANIGFKCGLAASISGLVLARQIVPGMAAVAGGLAVAWWLI